MRRRTGLAPMSGPSTSEEMSVKEASCARSMAPSSSPKNRGGRRIRRGRSSISAPHLRTRLLDMRSLEDALSLDAPEDDVDFFGAFDPNDEGRWCELVRDVVALANSGGGLVVVELGATPLALTVSAIDASVHHYTGSHLAGLRVVRAERRGGPVLVLEVEPEPYPLIFVRDAAKPKVTPREAPATN